MPASHNISIETAAKNRTIVLAVLQGIKENRNQKMDVSAFFGKNDRSDSSLLDIFNRLGVDIRMEGEKYFAILAR